MTEPVRDLMAELEVSLGIHRCPSCGLPLVRFDQPPTVGPTCNPISEPNCWIKTPLDEIEVRRNG